MADISDYIGSVEQFPVLRRWAYFNHAGVAPLPTAAAAAIHRVTDEPAAGAYLDTTWYSNLPRLRSTCASLINASPAEIALVKNTSEGISIVARGIDWQPGDRIVTAGVEYPANVYPWMEIARRHGVELVMVPEETDHHGRRSAPLDKILDEAARPRTRLLTLSHVQFASGQRLDIARAGDFCRSRGILFNVDAIQSLGVLPVDVQAMKIDFLSADSHKWMLGPEGAGIFYIRQALQDQIRPVLLGASSVINAQDYGSYDFTLRPDAGRYESGTLNIAGMYGMEASLALLQSIGMDAIAPRIKSLGDQLINGLELAGFQIISPRENDAWSGIVSFIHPDGNHAEIQKRLRQESKIEIAVRENRLRASPHFYNTEEQLQRLIEALAPFAPR